MNGRTSTAELADARAPFDRPYGSVPCVSWKLCIARPICLRLLLHFIRAAASRTFWTAGRSRPIRMAMMAITTSSSISVKARRALGLERNIDTSNKAKEEGGRRQDETRQLLF